MLNTSVDEFNKKVGVKFHGILILVSYAGTCG